MIDTHTHLESLKDPAAGIANARAAGLQWLVTIGMTVDNIEAEIAHAKREDGFVRVAVGIHPNKAGDFNRDDWPKVAELARGEHVVAIGETGFDTYHDFSPPLAPQQWLFERHCELARELELPLVIHTRAADDVTIEQLKAHAKNLTVILHCYSMPNRLEEVLAEGWNISFCGNVTYKSATDLQEAAAAVPLDRFMLETDAPYLTPVPHRGEKNEPAFVTHIYDFIAELRGIDVAELEAAVDANANRIYRLAPAGSRA